MGSGWDFLWQLCIDTVTSLWICWKRAFAPCLAIWWASELRPFISSLSFIRQIINNRISYVCVSLSQTRAHPHKSTHYLPTLGLGKLWTLDLLVIYFRFISWWPRGSVVLLTCNCFMTPNNFPPEPSTLISVCLSFYHRSICFLQIYALPVLLVAITI